MNLINALLETYDYALANDLVDNHKIAGGGQVLLPVYHSNKRSSGQDIFEIRIDSNSNAIGGRFLSKDEVIVFPITEESIIRSGSKIAPHATCDELSYLADRINPEKNNEYLEGIKKLLDFEKEGFNYENYRIIGEYILKNSIFNDFIEHFLDGKEHSLDEKFNLEYDEIDSNGKTNKKSLNLSKIFITFKIEKIMAGDVSTTKDKGLHEFYISYIEKTSRSEEKMRLCNVTGESGYCVARHRGIIGNAKLISISNKNETYFGRLKNGEDIYSISYRASQKVHNMVKYFLDSEDHKSYIGENAYLINWLSQDLNRGGLDLVSNVNSNEIDDEEDGDEIEEITAEKLGGRLSAQLGEYFLGKDRSFATKGDFYILIVEKISNGRVSIKYFRRLSRSEAYERVSRWYESTDWRFGKTRRSPTIYQIVNFIYGEENSQGFLSCENKKLMRSGIERLIPCITESKKIPKDISRAAFYKLSQKRSYKKAWNMALNVGCSVIKKYKYDYESSPNQSNLINPDLISEVKQLKESRSYYYGKLMAIYEKIELDATKIRLDEDDNKEGKSYRVTNSDRLWNSMIRNPEKTMSILESKIKPYIFNLKKRSPGSYVYYDKLITSIVVEIQEIDQAKGKLKSSLNEDFVFGYYYQKNELYKSKKDKQQEKVEIIREED